MDLFDKQKVVYMIDSNGVSEAKPFIDTPFRFTSMVGHQCVSVEQ